MFNLTIQRIIFFKLLTIFILISRKSFEVKPNNIVSNSYGVYCEINGKKENYEATTTRDNPNIEFYTTDNITLEDMNIEINKYKSKKKLINDVKKYIIKENGSCN